MFETYRKSARAQSSEGWESWVQDDLANTLTAFDVSDVSDVRATTLAVEAFQQNQREEVRSLGNMAGSLHVEPGMHEQNFLLTSSTGDSPARTSAWPASGPVLTALVAASGLSSSGCCPSCGHDGRSLRMSPDFYPATEDATLASFSAGWMTSGSQSHGRYWTRSTSESRNAAAACSLSQVLQDEVSSKFYLSAKAAAGILRRAERRGKSLPAHLERALRTLSGDTETTSTPTVPTLL